MSTSTVPMFSPDGQLGDVPYEQMRAALKAGFKPGVNMKTGDGKTGVIPADRMGEAVKGGLQIVPFEAQEAQHPGFWHAVTSDLAGLFQGGAGFSPYPGMDLEAKQRAAQSSADLNASEKAAGYGAAYRAVAPLAGAVGANVPGMEQAASAGDVGGVLGHAAIPVAAATAPLAAEGVARVAGAGLEAAKPTLKATGQRITETVGSLDADKVGMVSPRAAHAVRTIQKAGKILSEVGAAGEVPAAEPPPAEPYPSGAEPPAPKIPEKAKLPIPGVNVPPSIERIQDFAHPDNIKGYVKLMDLAAERQASGLTGNSLGYQRAASAIRELPSDQPFTGMTSDELADIKGIGPKTLPILEQLKEDMGKTFSKSQAVNAAGVPRGTVPPAEADLLDPLQRMLKQVKAGKKLRDLQ